MLDGVTPFPAEFAARYRELDLVFHANAERVLGL
jgi:hypothetical protein